MDHISMKHYFCVTHCSFNQTPSPQHLNSCVIKRKRVINHPALASMTLTSSFLGGCSAAAISKQLPTTTAAVGRYGLVIAKASSKGCEGEKIVTHDKGESSNGRRELVFAVAAAAACSIAKIAMADYEPKPGTPEARKKYGPICVTMPTARICRK